jgi:hypothetical protein
MIIRFFLNDAEVEKVYFKKFSSGCEAWVKLLEGANGLIANESGYIKLIYNTATNQVIPQFDQVSPSIMWIFEDVKSQFSENIESNRSFLEIIRRKIPGSFAGTEF